MDTSTCKSTVHIVGEYIPTCHGDEGVSERRLFRHIFTSSNQNAGADTVFVDGRKGLGFTDNYVRDSIRPGDVVVLLNPSIDVSTNALRHYFRVRVGKVADMIGQRRVVLAFQDVMLKRYFDQDLFGLSAIDYAPVVVSVGSCRTRTAYTPDPAPEGAIRIVAELLSEGAHSRS